MTDRLNLSFTNDEHDLYVKVQNLPNSSGTIKDLLRRYFAGTLSTPANPEKPELSLEEEGARIELIYRNCFGHISKFETVGDCIDCMHGEENVIDAFKKITDKLMKDHGASTYVKVMALFNDRHPQYGRFL